MSQKEKVIAAIRDSISKRMAIPSQQLKISKGFVKIEEFLESNEYEELFQTIELCFNHLENIRNDSLENYSLGILRKINGLVSGIIININDIENFKGNPDPDPLNYAIGLFNGLKRCLEVLKENTDKYFSENAKLGENTLVSHKKNTNRFNEDIYTDGDRDRQTAKIKKLIDDQLSIPIDEFLNSTTAKLLISRFQGSVSEIQLSSDSPSGILQRVYAVFWILSLSSLSYLSTRDFIAVIKNTNKLIELLGKIKEDKIQTESDTNKFEGQIFLEISDILAIIASKIDFYMTYIIHEILIKPDLMSAIEKFNRSKGEYEKLFGSLKKSQTENQELFKKRLEKFDLLNVQMKEVVALVGTSALSKIFMSHSDRLFKESKKWLRVSGFLTAIVIVFALVQLCDDTTYESMTALLPVISMRVIILGTLITATLWCGKNFRTLRHQSVVNQERADIIKTVGAFSQEGYSERVKDLVLTEAVHSVFTPLPSGFIDQGSSRDGRGVINLLNSRSGSKPDDPN